MNKNTIYDGNIYVIGITGSIASGKSLVGSQLKSMGIAVIDLDHLTHELLNNQGPVYDRVIARFGQDIAPTPGAPIDRKKLGGIVFGDEKARKDLEAILHPAIRDLRDKKINDLARQGNSIVAILVPLLFETNTQDQYNEVWMVTAHEDIQLVRLVYRDKLSEADARKRLEAQWPQDKKVQLADRIINNSASPNLTLERVKTVLNEAQSEAQKPRVRVPAPAPSSSLAPASTPASAPATTDTGSGAAAGNDNLVEGDDEMVNPTTPATADSTSLPAATTVTEDGTLEADLTGAQVTEPAAETEVNTSPVPATVETPAVTPADEVDLNGAQVTEPAAETEVTTSPVPATVETPAVTPADEIDLNGPQVTGPAAETEVTTSPVPPVTETSSTPNSSPHPHRRYSQQTILLAFFALLAFLATLVALTIAGNTSTTPAGKATASTTTNQPPVKAVKADTGEAVLKLIEEGGDLFKFKCIPPDTRCQNQIHSINQSTTVSSHCGEVTTSEEAPAFALRYLHNEVRWQVALWNLSNDHISCQSTVLEGRNRDGNLVVRQLYAKTLAFQGQYTVAYMVGAIRVDRFNSYNRFDGRTVYHFNDKGRLIEATLLNSQQRPVNTIFVEHRDGTTSISKEASYTTDGALQHSKIFETASEAQDFINNTFYLPELISGN